MMGRFTERVRKVMDLANDLAQQFNHEYVGADHILLGLLKEGTGVGASVLMNLGVGYAEAHAELGKIVKDGTGAVFKKKLAYMGYTDEATEVIGHAIEESHKLGQDFVGTEHLLLALLTVPNTSAAQVLTAMGLKLDDARDETLKLLGCELSVSEQKAHPVIDETVLAAFAQGAELGRSLTRSVSQCLNALSDRTDDPAGRLAGQIVKDLNELIAAWPHLSQDVRDTILTLTRRSK